MIYTIALMRGAQVLAVETLRGEPDIAKALSKALVEKGDADRTEVRDVNGSLIYHYPRTFPT